MLLKVCPVLPASAVRAVTTVVTAVQALLVLVVVTAADLKVVAAMVPQLLHPLQPRLNRPTFLN